MSSRSVKTVYRTAAVRGVEQLTPSVKRIRFAGADLYDVVDVGPDQSVKIFFPRPGQVRPQLPPVPGDSSLSWYRTYLAMPEEIRPPMRTYTVRALRADRAEIDIDFVLHGDRAPASYWARHAKPGDEIALLGPHALDGLPGASGGQLLVGDETATLAIGAILESLGPDTTARAFIEVPGSADQQHFRTEADVEPHWVARDGARHGRKLLEALSGGDLSRIGRTWIAGEAGMVRNVRTHLVRERGIRRETITFTGYWRRGKSEEDIGVERIERGTAEVNELDG